MWTHVTDTRQESWKDVDINCMWTSFLSRLFSNVTKMKINCCRTVRPYRRGMPQDLLPQSNLLKWGDILSRTRDDLSASVCRYKQDVHILMNMHIHQQMVTSVTSNWNALKPNIVQDYHKHMGYIDLGNRMTNSYLIQRWTWKWTQKLFFHFLDMIILNSFLLLTACGTKITCRDLQLSVMQNLIERAGSLPQPRQLLGRSCDSQKQVTWLEVNFSSHWSYPSPRLCCWVCSTRGINKNTWSQVQEVCCRTVPWWVFWRLSYSIKTESLVGDGQFSAS
jgi:hypothetical protein